MRIKDMRETEIEVQPEPCEICGSIHYDYLVKDKCGDIVGCDDCITRVYSGEREKENEY